MGYRTPEDVKGVFSAHPRRALILTTVVHESRAVQAHLKDRELLTSRKGGVYEYGRFIACDVHTVTLQRLSDSWTFYEAVERIETSIDGNMKRPMLIVKGL